MLDRNTGRRQVGGVQQQQQYYRTYILDAERVTSNDVRCIVVAVAAGHVSLYTYTGRWREQAPFTNHTGCGDTVRSYLVVHDDLEVVRFTGFTSRITNLLVPVFYAPHCVGVGEGDQSFCFSKPLRNMTRCFHVTAIGHQCHEGPRIWVRVRVRKVCNTINAPYIADVASGHRNNIITDCAASIGTSCVAPEIWVYLSGCPRAQRLYPWAAGLWSVLLLALSLLTSHPKMRPMTSVHNVGGIRRKKREWCWLKANNQLVLCLSNCLSDDSTNYYSAGGTKKRQVMSNQDVLLLWGWSYIFQQQRDMVCVRQCFSCLILKLILIDTLSSTSSVLHQHSTYVRNGIHRRPLYPRPRRRTRFLF